MNLPNKLLDGFEGRLTSSKWAAIAKCSPDTALRDINDLLTRGMLRKSDAGGRSTSYELNDLPEWRRFLELPWLAGGIAPSWTPANSFGSDLPNHITLSDPTVDPPALWDEQRERVGL